jgi:hypothetical protein
MSVGPLDQNVMRTPPNSSIGAAGLKNRLLIEANTSKFDVGL